MPLAISNIVFDCSNPALVATFWAAALRYARHTERDDRAWVYHPDGTLPRLLFNKVPEPKIVKNRVHLDLGTNDMEAEVARLVQLGASKIRLVEEEGDRWWIMADPEGDEFCVP